jgi:hypothetical protein
MYHATSGTLQGTSTCTEKQEKRADSIDDSVVNLFAGKPSIVPGFTTEPSSSNVASGLIWARTAFPETVSIDAIANKLDNDCPSQRHQNRVISILPFNST